MLLFEGKNVVVPAYGWVYTNFNIKDADLFCNNSKYELFYLYLCLVRIRIRINTTI